MEIEIDDDDFFFEIHDKALWMKAEPLSWEWFYPELPNQSEATVLIDLEL